MDLKKKIGEKIKFVKGKLSYSEFSKAIEKETGVSIHHTTLQKYVTGNRLPSKKSLEAISQYSKRPVSWFFEYRENNLMYKLPKEILDFLNQNPDTTLPYLKLSKKAQEMNIPPEALEDVLAAFKKVREDKPDKNNTYNTSKDKKARD